MPLQLLCTTDYLWMYHGNECRDLVASLLQLQVGPPAQEAGLGGGLVKEPVMVTRKEEAFVVASSHGGVS
jgi:hypothetical protein